MTLQQIDAALAAWNNRLASVADNLLELQAEPTYQVLTGSGGMTKMVLSGASKARVDPALGAMRIMFEQFGLLHGTIDEAVKIRSGLPALFGGDQKMAEIEKLLFGKSIQLPAVDIPLEQRSLLSGVRSAQCLTAEELLEPMTRSFAAARDAVIAVCNANAGLAAGIANAEAQMQALETATGSSAALKDANRILQEIRDKLHTDPLGAMEDLTTQVQPLLAKVAQMVAAVEEVKRKIQKGRVLLDDLEKLHRDTLAAAAEARAKVTDCDKLVALRAWLDRLDARRGEEAVAVGLRNWQAAADDCVAQERKALAANRAPVELRNELRGRLDALKSKARAYGIAEHGPVAELARQAEGLLYTRPTDLKRAAAAVAGYEKSLVGGMNRP